MAGLSLVGGAAGNASMVDTMVATAARCKMDDATLAQLVDQRKGFPGFVPPVPAVYVNHMNSVCLKFLKFHFSQNRRLDALIEAMKNCWSTKASQRWTVQQVLETLQRKMPSAYGDAMMTLGQRIDTASRDAVDNLKRLEHSEEMVRRVMHFMGHLMPPELCYAVLTGTEPQV